MALLLACIGCADGGPAVDQQHEELKLRGLVNLHAHAVRHLGHAPRNEEEFKKFVRERGADVVERLKLAAVDDLFISSRDGKPYIVLYGPPTNQAASDVVVYESEGANGERLVGYQTGAVRKLNDEQFTALGL